MPDPEIQAFFSERKVAWLKKESNASMQEADILALQVKCDTIFSAEQWLPNAARRAGQIRMSTHPCTFSHPSAQKNKNGKTTVIIASAPRRPDGYLKTGSTYVETDALGNAAALDVYKFLTLTMQDGQSLLHHIQQDSPLANQLLSIQSASYQTLKEGFLAMAESDSDVVTSSKIKQVYFPVDDGYHQLSLLSNSGILYQLRSRIDALRFAEKNKPLRELKRKNSYSEEGFSEIYNITTIGYGGTKPQNISVLNNKNGGKAHLLLSIPPELVVRSVYFPTTNFFGDTVRYYHCREPLKKLHNIFSAGLDSVIPRRNLQSGRDHRIEEIFDTLIKHMWAVRSVSDEQYREDSSQLPSYQKLWLCEHHQDQRQIQDDWLDQLCQEIAKWIARAYKHLVKKPVALGEVELNYIQRFIQAHREALR